MLYQWLPAIVLIGLASANVVLTVRLCRLTRRYAVLNMLMAKLCADAWRHRHLPIWTAWAAGTGYGFRVVADLPHEAEDIGKK